MGNFMKFRRKITAFMAEHGSQAKDIFDGNRSPRKAPTPPTMNAASGSRSMAAVQMMMSFIYRWPPGTGTPKELITTFSAMNRAVTHSHKAVLFFVDVACI